MSKQTMTDTGRSTYPRGPPSGLEPKVRVVEGATVVPCNGRLTAGPILNLAQKVKELIPRATLIGLDSMRFDCSESPHKGNAVSSEGWGPRQAQRSLKDIGVARNLRLRI